jgi:antitoxin MazE
LAVRRTIHKWGNSLAVRIPRDLARELRLDLGTEVDMLIDGGTLVLTPVRLCLSLGELVSRITSDNKHPENDVGGPRGREVW